MKYVTGRRKFGLLLLVGLAIGMRGGGLWAQAGAAGGGPGGAAPAQPAAAPATAPGAAQAATLPKVDDLLPKKTVVFDFTAKPIKDILAYLGESYDLRVVNQYEKEDAATMNLSITMKLPAPLTAREAITLLNDTLVALGYAAVPSVKGDPPEVVVTVTPTARDGPAVARAFYGSDPEQIPQGDEIRTQVFTLNHLEPAAAKDAIAPVLGRRADVTLNATAKTMIVTDTSSRIHTAAVLIQALEKQAGTARTAPGVDKKE